MPLELAHNADDCLALIRISAIAGRQECSRYDVALCVAVGLFSQAQIDFGVGVTHPPEQRPSFLVSLGGELDCFLSVLIRSGHYALPPHVKLHTKANTTIPVPSGTRPICRGPTSQAAGRVSYTVSLRGITPPHKPCTSTTSCFARGTASTRAPDRSRSCWRQPGE
jgi:hypothetical protein